MGNKVIYAVYEDPELLKDGARKLVSNGVKVKDVYSPFPVHGIDPIIGITRTRLAIVAFMFGIMGLSLALLGIWYFNIFDWPMNIGGKPSQAMYKTLPGMPARNPDPRSTDDKFIIEVRTSENQGHSAEVITGLLRETSVFEINERQY